MKSSKQGKKERLCKGNTLKKDQKNSLSVGPTTEKWSWVIGPGILWIR